MSIVVGYTPSAQGEAALRAGAAQARRTRDCLVVASHHFHDPEAGWTVASPEQVQEAIAALGAEELKVTVRTGAPAEDAGEFLLSVAEEEKAALVVIGLRRKSPIGKLNLGAAARRVVLGSSCPVLTVKESLPLAGR